MDFRTQTVGGYFVVLEEDELEVQKDLDFTIVSKEEPFEFAPVIEDPTKDNKVGLLVLLLILFLLLFGHLIRRRKKYLRVFSFFFLRENDQKLIPPKSFYTHYHNSYTKKTRTHGKRSHRTKDFVDLRSSTLQKNAQIKKRDHR